MVFIVYFFRIHLKNFFDMKFSRVSNILKKNNVIYRAIIIQQIFVKSLLRIFQRFEKSNLSIFNTRLSINQQFQKILSRSNDLFYDQLTSFL